MLTTALTHPASTPPGPQAGGDQLFWDNNDHWAVTEHDDTLRHQDPDFAVETMASTLVGIASSGAWTPVCVSCPSIFPTVIDDFLGVCGAHS